MSTSRPGRRPRQARACIRGQSSYAWRVKNAIALNTSVAFWVLFLVAWSPPVRADEVDKVAKSYLKALADSKNQTGKEYLLGGVTLDAKNAVAYDPKILKREAPRKEHGKL